tara:strand:- start:49360 stop:49974 length:615 start_codon:yes stop_codon:yes gene_type:complete
MEQRRYEDLAEQLSQGGLFLYPTETIWGLGCDGFNPVAVDKVFEIKGREQTKAVSLLVRDYYMAQNVAEISSRAKSLIEWCWPGPLTLVLPAKENVPVQVHGGTGFVGLRCSDHPFIQKLFHYVRTPIVTTSANRSGEPPALNFEEAKQLDLGVEIAPWIENTGLGQPSTVIKLEGEKGWVLREGAIPKTQLLEMAKDLSIHFQ